MRVFHILPTLAFGDAVSNDALALNRLLVNSGYRSRLYAVRTQPRFQNGLVHSIDCLPQTLPEDILLYHLSTGDEFNDKLMELPGHKLIIYHNVTPSEFFKPYNKQAAELTSNGYRQVEALASCAEYCIADSHYNAEELHRMGYSCPIDVVPILIPFEDYKRQPDITVQRQYDDGRTNLLFVGRVAPNKRQEDVIRVFDCYKKQYDPTARLFLVGNYDKGDPYYKTLIAYCKKMGVKDVVFPGHIRFEEVLAYYSIADVFVCMSDHEGFCVPLVEAMCFDLPIIAKDTTAIADTLAGGGLLLKDSDPAVAAAAIHRLLSDEALRQSLHEKQMRQLEELSESRVSAKFLESFCTSIKKAGLER